MLAASATTDTEAFLKKARDTDDPAEAKDWTLAAKNSAGTALALVQTSVTLDKTRRAA